MGNSVSENDFVVIDLPVRMSTPELLRLNLAVAKAIRRETPSNICLPNDAMVAALEEAKRLLKLRRAREKAFGADLFSDASWDMLLELFAAEGSTQRVSVSSACISSAAPPTTALRHLATLEQRGFVSRDRSAIDNRVIYVRLTSEAVGVMQRLLVPH